MRKNMLLTPMNFDRMISNVFDRSISDFVGSDFISSFPKANIEEGDDHYKIELAVPGLKKEDFKIEINNNQLKISSERSNESEDVEEGKFTRKEFSYSSFVRTFELDDTIDREGLNASYNNGILSVMLPKKEEAKKKGPHYIEVK